MSTKSSPRLDALLERLRLYCEAEHGRKIALARYLDVGPHKVSEWLSPDGSKPNGESTLGIQEWLANELKPSAKRQH